MRTGRMTYQVHANQKKNSNVGFIDIDFSILRQCKESQNEFMSIATGLGIAMDLALAYAKR